MPMREDKKKHDEEMLIVHKPGPKADPAMAGRSHAEPPRATSLDKDELALIKKQIGMTKDPGLRRELLGRIQHRFGNDRANEVVREMRLKSSDDDLKSKPPAGGGKSGTKGKA
jgi:hypothetical protein